jgi:glycosyltransferase involved in cell wall biosynthesis
MSNILLLGIGPLPQDPGDQLFAPGLRTEQFAKVLAQAGHRVTLVVSEFSQSVESASGQGGRKPGLSESERCGISDQVTIRRMVYHPEQSAEILSTVALTGRFDAIVSTTDLMNHLSAKLSINLPRWMDFNGDPFAEKQMQASIHSHDGSLGIQLDYMLPALVAGDRFSACSQSQALALVGQLALAGRLNGATRDEQFVVNLPPASRAMLELEQRLGRRVNPASLTLPPGAIKVLWSGGYNTWVDVETLFSGLERAMEENPLIYFLSTGGAIQGHNQKTIVQFRDLISKSPLADRFHFLGWISTWEIPYLYRFADMALNIDRPCYEGELGMRNRIVDWLSFELPVISTITCDFVAQAAENNAVYTVRTGNGAELAQRILEVASNLQSAKDRAKEAKQWLDRELNPQKIFQPLLDWASSPTFLGDRVIGNQKAMPDFNPGYEISRSLLAQRQLKGRLFPPRPSFLRRLFGRLAPRKS